MRLVHSRKKNPRLARLAGLGMVGAGIAHFVSPQLFEPMTESIFGESTRKRVYTNGCVETTLGLGVTVRSTRPLAIVATIGYMAYLVGNFSRN